MKLFEITNWIYTFYSGITNEAVLDRIKEKRKRWYSIKVKRDKIIGHLLCCDSLTKSVVEGDVGGHIGRGGPRMVYMKQIMIDSEKNC